MGRAGGGRGGGDCQAGKRGGRTQQRTETGPRLAALRRKADRKGRGRALTAIAAHNPAPREAMEEQVFTERGRPARKGAKKSYVEADDDF